MATILNSRTTGRAANRAPAVQAVRETNLADLISYRRTIIHKRRWLAAGYLMGMSFNRSDDAAYTTHEIQERWKREAGDAQALRRKSMLHVVWEARNYPLVGNGGNNIFVFPQGLTQPDTLKDARIDVPIKPGEKIREFSQDLLDYVDGYIKGRDGSVFMVIQPLISIAWVAHTHIFTYRGEPEPGTGTYPAFLFSPNFREAHIVGGFLRPTT